MRHGQLWYDHVKSCTSCQYLLFTYSRTSHVRGAVGVEYEPVNIFCKGCMVKKLNKLFFVCLGVDPHTYLSDYRLETTAWSCS